MSLEKMHIDILNLIREFYADTYEPTPTAKTMKEYFSGEGRLQNGSRYDVKAGRIWLRPFKIVRWYADRAI